MVEVKDKQEAIVEVAAEAAGQAAEPQPLEVTIGVEEGDDGQGDDGQPAPQWVKDLRAQNRELKKKLKEARQAADMAAPPAVSVPDPGAKPTLEGCGFDSDAYEKAYGEWSAKKAEADRARAAAEADAKGAEERWVAKQAAYGEARVKFEADDFQDAEDAVSSLLSVTQQGILVHGSADPATLIYALGKNEARARELAAIKDPVEFAFAAGRLEAGLKVTRKPGTPPEGRVVGNVGSSGAVGSTLERLRDEAARTGDYSKLSAYKREMKRKGQA